MNVADLRPASIGQLLDRAVTLGVKFFVPLALILGAFQIPVSVISVYASSGTWRSIAQVLEAIQRHAGPAELNRIMTQSPGTTSVTYLFYFLVFLVTPLGNGALVAAIGGAYLDREPLAFGAAYRRALGAWLPLIVVTLIWIAIGLLAYVCVILAFVATGIVVALAYAAVHVLGIALGAIAGLGLFVALLALGAVAFPAVAYSYFAVVIEGAPFITAVTSGIARTFGRSVRRSLWTGLAGIAFLTGFSLIQMLVLSLVSGGLAAIVPVIRQDPIIAVIVGSIAGVPIGMAGTILSTAFFEIAYFDMRVRSEGFDLERAAIADAVALPAPE